VPQVAGQGDTGCGEVLLGRCSSAGQAGDHLPSDWARPGVGGHSAGSIKHAVGVGCRNQPFESIIHGSGDRLGDSRLRSCRYVGRQGRCLRLSAASGGLDQTADRSSGRVEPGSRAHRGSDLLGQILVHPLDAIHELGELRSQLGRRQPSVRPCIVNSLAASAQRRV
jgi:hypothetical protein